MSLEIVVEGKAVGQKHPLFTDWRIGLPPMWENHGDHLRLKDLITSVVIEEVNAFRQRQNERKLARIMSKDEIEYAAAKGKVDSGERDLNQQVDLDEAIANALEAFSDGLYFVFVDDVQETSLEGEVFMKSESKVVFLRLVALAGG